MPTTSVKSLMHRPEMKKATASRTSGSANNGETWTGIGVTERRVRPEAMQGNQGRKYAAFLV